MKKILAILIITITYCCKSKVENEKSNLENDTAIDTSKITDQAKKIINDTPTKIRNFNIEYLRNNTINFSDYVQVADNEGRSQIPKEFLENYISNKKIVIGYPEFLTSYYPESYYFQNFKEYKNYILFTFTHFDESCCNNLYAVTSKKDSLNIINIGLIGYMGGDGGWYGEQYGFWKNDSILKITEVSNYDEDLIEENNNTKIDTTWSKIKFDKNGVISKVEIDSISYLGNQKIQ
ncbi:hypothetical protein [Mesoflavibacter sp. CH_XMU1404-2]|uniref:hypothetical protein n=1 Tax=Mesoflavibacter sp. CH_XMU1404-2 TaxID=3107766 RepID=UPI00243CF68B|tara:strand:- start:295 stop:999 length:705 start_codon:yes stop_codon:yes gene_type:complete